MKENTRLSLFLSTSITPHYKEYSLVKVHRGTRVSSRLFSVSDDFAEVNVYSYVLLPG